MDSSTSPSEPRRWPARTAMLAGILVAAWAVSALYTLRVNPEVRLFQTQARHKLDWIRHRIPATNRVLVFGGSSSGFSLSPAYALTRGVGLGNLGINAGMGFKVLTRIALREARPGDTLVMAMEPDLLAGDGAVTLIGAQAAIVFGSTALGSDVDDPSPDLPASPVPYLWALRPGGYHAVTMLGKLLRGRPPYRYTPADVLEDGQQQTAVRGDLAGFTGVPTPRLSPEARRWLRKTRDWCESQGVRLVFALPWTYTEPSAVDHVRQLHAALLAEVAAEVPVLEDPKLGCITDRSLFCDTVFHMTLEGSRQRTAALLDELAAGRFWTVEELRKQAGTDARTP